MNDAVKDFIIKYGNLHEWVCFLDLDEFIFSQSGVQLREFLNTLDPNVSSITLTQKKFLDRFLTKERFITQEYGCINNLKIGTEWAPKNIVRCRDFVACQNIHDIKTRKTTLVVNENILRFNHYNINDKQLNWMKTFYKSEIPFKINSIDDGMSRYEHLFDDITNNIQVIVPKIEQKQPPNVSLNRSISMFSLYNNIDFCRRSIKRK